MAIRVREGSCQLEVPEVLLWTATRRQLIERAGAGMARIRRDVGWLGLVVEDLTDLFRGLYAKRDELEEPDPLPTLREMAPAVAALECVLPEADPAKRDREAGATPSGSPLDHPGQALVSQSQGSDDRDADRLIVLAAAAIPIVDNLAKLIDYLQIWLEDHDEGGSCPEESNRYWFHDRERNVVQFDKDDFDGAAGLRDTAIVCWLALQLARRMADDPETQPQVSPVAASEEVAAAAERATTT